MHRLRCQNCLGQQYWKIAAIHHSNHIPHHLASPFCRLNIYDPRPYNALRGEHLSLVRITWVTRAFVIGDILSFWVQGASSSLITKSDTVKIGEYMVIGGLAIQIISFGLFLLTAIIFQIRIAKQPTQASYHVKAPWKQTLYMLYAVSILILIRSAFRVIEFIQGQDGYALRHEWTLYVFDSVPMILVTMLFYFRYPSKIIPQTAGCDELSETRDYILRLRELKANV